MKIFHVASIDSYTKREMLLDVLFTQQIRMNMPATINTEEINACVAAEEVELPPPAMLLNADSIHLHVEGSAEYTSNTSFQ